MTPKEPLPYARQLIDEHDVRAVADALQSGWLTTGPSVAAFEQRLCEITGARHAVACANGTAALHLACMALDIGPGDTGVTSPITFLASANCIEFCGARTDFVDADPGSICLSPERLEQYCESVGSPRVVIPVDFAGVPADLGAIHDMAGRYGFAVIEDAAHAIGSTYRHNGQTYACGGCAHSDLAILSFHPVKTITTGEGGAVTTNNGELASRLRLLRNHAMTKDPSELTRDEGPWYYEMHRLSYNYRITDLQCALGSSQLDKLEAFKQRRTALAERYHAAFADTPSVQTPSWPHTSAPCLHLYPVRFTGGRAVRRAVYDRLAEHDIFAQVHYYPVHLQPYYAAKYGYAEGKCPAAEQYYEQCLSLPLFPAMSDNDAERVAVIVRDAVAGSR